MRDFFKKILKKTKILLVVPENNGICEQANPIAILDVAPYLRKRGFEVDVCVFPKLPKDKRYDFIGISCVASYQGDIFRQLEIIKNKYKKSRILVGGKWSTTMEPEDKKRLGELNIEVIDKAAEIFFTDEDKIDFANYPSWDEKDFKILYQREHLMSSRGCPFKCNFCNNTEQKINYFSAKRTVNNIELVLKKHGFVFICDDIFVTNYNHAKSIYDECKKRKIDIENKIYFFVHVKYVNDSTFNLIKLYQPMHVSIGIESGDDRILEKMNKKNKVAEIRSAVIKLSKITKVRGTMIVGFPHKTLETLENSYNLRKELAPYLEYCWVSHYIPLVGTVGHKMAIEFGGEFFLPVNNRTVSYVPKRLTKEVLVEYREKMMQLNENEIK